jgi:hypothetical protein
VAKPQPYARIGPKGKKHHAEVAVERCGLRADNQKHPAEKIQSPVANHSLPIRAKGDPHRRTQRSRRHDRHRREASIGAEFGCRFKHISAFPRVPLRETDVDPFWGSEFCILHSESPRVCNLRRNMLPRNWCTVSHIMMTSLRSKWASSKARGGHIPLHFLYSWCSWSLPGCVKVGRDVTDEQRDRRPIFNATLWDAASWLFFRVGRSARISSDMGASLAP